MVEQTSLSVSIDASGAKRGATEFSRAADDIKRKAVEMRQAVDRGNQAFRNMLSVAENSSRTLSLANELNARGKQVRVSRNAIVDSVGSADTDVRPQIINATIHGSFREPTTTSLAVKPLGQTADPLIFRILKKVNGIGDAIEIIEALNDQVEERKLLEQQRAQEIDRSIDEARGFLITANDTSKFSQERVIAENKALDRLENALSLLQESIVKELARERKQNEAFDAFEERTGQNPRSVGRRELSLHERGVRDANIRLQKEMAPVLAQIQALGEAIATIRDERPADTVSPQELNRHGSSDPSESFSSSCVELDSIKQQMEDLKRCIDQLKEQQATFQGNANTAASAGQKEQSLDLLQREKECLERLNEALRENQTLRGVTGEQSDDVLKGAAAYDDLSTAVEQNGSASKELKDQVDALNTALQSNADINALIVDGLEKERDARQQVNQQVVERRQLDRDQGQRLIAAQKDVADSAEAVDASIEQIRNAAKDSFKDVIKGTESVGDAFQKLADRITDILLDLALEELLKGGTGFSDLFGTIFGGIGSVFGGSAAAGPLVPASTAQLTPFLGGPGGTFDLISALHTGGIVGRAGQPRLVAANFNAAPRFHGGGVAGLAPDEIPIIAERGEEVLTRNDPRHRDNVGTGGGLGGGAPNITVNNNISFPNARNTQEAREAGSEIAAKAAAAAQRGMARKGLG